MIFKKKYKSSFDPKIIDGKSIAKAINADTARIVHNQLSYGTPKLVVIQAGNNPESNKYISTKEKVCKANGMNFELIKFNANCSESDLIFVIKRLNTNKDVSGIIVQLPLPKHLNEQRIIDNIKPIKDVDRMTTTSIGELSTNKSILAPCTPSGILEMLKRVSPELNGKHCVIVGRSNIVGKPMAQLMLNANCTVTIAHSRSKELHKITRLADILIVAVGKPGMITAKYIKKGAIVIDVGINVFGSTITGDVCFSDVYKKAKAITPVPGGVGPMTVAMLVNNTAHAFIEQRKREI